MSRFDKTNRKRIAQVIGILMALGTVDRSKIIHKNNWNPGKRIAKTAPITNVAMWHVWPRSLGWEFKDATLVRQLDNGTVVPSGVEGLLYVTFVNKQSGEKMRGTVCKDQFNKQAATLFCRHVGYQVKDPSWGFLSHFEYVPTWVPSRQSIQIAYVLRDW